MRNANPRREPPPPPAPWRNEGDEEDRPARDRAPVPRKGGPTRGGVRIHEERREDAQDREEPPIPDDAPDEVAHPVPLSIRHSERNIFVHPRSCRDRTIFRHRSWRALTLNPEP